MSSGVNSTAETLMFYFTADTTTPRGDDFVLFRKVNNGSPAVVARNILQTPGRPFFEYLYLAEHDTSAQTVEVFSNVELVHSAPIHGRLDGARADTGRAGGWIDLVRGVRVNLTTTDGTTGTAERRRSVTRVIMLPNAGVTRLETCGEVPQFGATFTAVPTLSGAPLPTVTLQWTPAVDESRGEKDVMRYIVWKRAALATDWGPPFASVAAGVASYTYVDDQVEHGKKYEYAIAAQDCTPSLSSLSILSNVVVP
jgi:hypothetical protein